jgi:serine/threonine protein kinase
MQIGDMLGHYVLVEVLGEGGMGVVWKAEDTHLHRTVAIKFVAPRALDLPSIRERLLKEARAAAALQHPMFAPFTRSTKRIRIWSWNSSTARC